MIKRNWFVCLGEFEAFLSINGAADILVMYTVQKVRETGASTVFLVWLGQSVHICDFVIKNNKNKEYNKYWLIEILTNYVTQILWLINQMCFLHIFEFILEIITDFYYIM